MKGSGKKENKTLSNILFLEKYLNSTDPDSEHIATIYSESNDEITDAALNLKKIIVYPHYNEQYYSFTYKSDLNPNIIIKIKGPIVKK